MNVGIDLGRTIVDSDSTRIGSHFAEKQPFPHAFEIIKKLVNICDNVYIVSKVNSEQKAAAEKWFTDVDFYNATGIKPENVYFCFERRDKAFFVKGLNINVFIDDRPEVLSYMDKYVRKILFNPYKPDVEKYKKQIDEHKMYFVSNWKEIGDLFYKKDDSV